MTDVWIIKVTFGFEVFCLFWQLGSKALVADPAWEMWRTFP